MRFLTYYVNVTKCLPYTKHMQNPNETVLGKVPWLKGIPLDAYERRLESHYTVALDMYGKERYVNAHFPSFWFRAILKQI